MAADDRDARDLLPPPMLVPVPLRLDMPPDLRRDSEPPDRRDRALGPPLPPPLPLVGLAGGRRRARRDPRPGLARSVVPSTSPPASPPPLPLPLPLPLAVALGVVCTSGRVSTCGADAVAIASRGLCLCLCGPLTLQRAVQCTHTPQQLLLPTAGGTVTFGGSGRLTGSEAHGPALLPVGQCSALARGRRGSRSCTLYCALHCLAAWA